MKVRECLFLNVDSTIKHATELLNQKSKAIYNVQRLLLFLSKNIVDREISQDCFHLFLDACRKSRAASINGLALYGTKFIQIIIVGVAMNIDLWNDLFATLKSPAFSLLRDLNLTGLRALHSLELETGLTSQTLSSVLETLLAASIQLHFMEIDCVLLLFLSFSQPSQRRAR